ncbi:MAG: hypothetical protein LBN97_02235 [Oscillospiraceae bacterium]|jgi:O-antigen/teichoic acid export membrane protein|nr:hypothetical protein [Oscillospiraceae bacterium]
MSNLSDKKRISLNLIATLVSVGVFQLTSLFVVTFVTRNIGVEAQGFVQLAYNATSYISIITIALNSMSSRFITYAIARGENEQARQYYASVFFANIALFTVLGIPLILCIVNINKLINVSPEFLTDVRIVFSLAVASMVLSNVLSVWNAGFYAKDVIFLQNIGNAITQTISAVIVVILFLTFPPKMWYYMLSGVVVIPLMAAWAFYNKCRFFPELKIKRSLYSFAKLKEVLVSGTWNALQSVGAILLTGLDLLICNVLVGPVAMGVLALSRTIPGSLQSIGGQIAATFAPNLVIRHANGDNCEYEISRSCKILAVFCAIPISVMFVFGKQFYGLWLPGEDARLLYLLSLPLCFNLALSVGTFPIANVFPALDKLKAQSISIIVTGVVSVVTVVALLKTTELGVYALAIVSPAAGLLQIICYRVPMAAKLLKLRWYKLFPGFAYSIVCTAISAAVAFGFSRLIAADTWLGLILAVVPTAVVSAGLNICAIFNRGEKLSLLASVRGALKIISKTGKSAE